MKPPKDGLPVVLARRLVPIRVGHQRRCLEIAALGDTRIHVDCWLTLRNDQGVAVGRFWLRPAQLREVARALTSLAAELGVKP